MKHNDGSGMWIVVAVLFGISAVAQISVLISKASTLPDVDTTIRCSLPDSDSQPFVCSVGEDKTCIFQVLEPIGKDNGLNVKVKCK